MKKVIDRQVELGGDKLDLYEVFARRNSEEPLTHIGSIDAPNAELAEARAWFVYDHDTWKEMCIVPLSAIVTITERGSNAKVKVV
ncbi:phenylacetic acid degradation b [Bradyrhizobium canariense]|uniref:phenylacetic acid degradation b n=1 Tax=Bradyrhizobium canariense TaxID=255045 RepID=UPI001B8A1CD5|nr:phenylacetic acid degradation b [Bradyrhizobium canariense]MBR0954917.1 phenylacetic acid degradation b [Bradyrhizobium canariense]